MMRRLSLKSGKLFVAVIFLFFVGCDDENGVGTDCDTSSFQSEFQDLGGSDPTSHELMFSCPTSISIPMDAAPYRDLQFVLDFNGYLREVASSWIDESCFSCCDLEANMTQCIEADCMTGDGATLYYRYEESFFPGEEEYDSHITQWSETIEVTPPPGAETWEKLEIEFHKSYEDNRGYDARGGDTSSYNVKWTGSMLPDWPTDFAVSSTYLSISSDIYYWTESEWNHPQCDMTIHMAGETLIDEGFGHDVEIGIDTLEVKKPVGSSSFQGWINDVCVGEVDEDTWEIIGPC